MCRKVAHALLTRPPLSQSRLWPKSPSTMLRSTWMCYARRQRSSWARIKLSNVCYLNPLSRNSNLIRAWLLFTFCLSSIFSQNCRVPFNTYMFPCSMLVLSSCCSIFNDRFFSPARCGAWLLYHNRFRLSRVFSNFFEIFSNLFLQPPRTPRSRRDLPIILHPFSFVKRFFEKSFKKSQKTFLKNFWFFCKNLLTNPNIYDIIHRLTARWSSG